jgi:hypothetical protein
MLGKLGRQIRRHPRGDDRAAVFERCLNVVADDSHRFDLPILQIFVECAV